MWAWPASGTTTNNFHHYSRACDRDESSFFVTTMSALVTTRAGVEQAASRKYNLPSPASMQPTCGVGGVRPPIQSPPRERGRKRPLCPSSTSSAKLEKCRTQAQQRRMTQKGQTRACAFNEARLIAPKILFFCYHIRIILACEGGSLYPILSTTVDGCCAIGAGLMDELAGLLPFPKEVTSQMDTKTVLRLAVCYLR